MSEAFAECPFDRAARLIREAREAVGECWGQCGGPARVYLADAVCLLERAAPKVEKAKAKKGRAAPARKNWQDRARPELRVSSANYDVFLSHDGARPAGEPAWFAEVVRRGRPGEAAYATTRYATPEGAEEDALAWVAAQEEWADGAPKGDEP